MTDTEDQTHFTLWCIMAAPLVMGNNLTTMSAQALATLTNPEAIAVDQDPAGEEGVKVVNMSTATSTNEVWSRTLGSDFSTKAVVLFNRLGPATNITCYWTNLGLRAGTATVRDLWAHTNLGTFTDSFTTNVGSHAAVLLKVVGTPPPLPGLGTNYLSDLQAVYAYTGWGTIIKDKSIGGNTLTLNGVTYNKGIGLNSRAGLDYDLGGICSRFQATVGIDDEEGSKGSVHFEVFADGVKIYDSGVMTGGAIAQTLDLDVTGVSRLILGVGDADDGTSYDHADWANARVIVTNAAPRAPYVPAGLAASPGTAVTLTWNSTLAALGYNVKRSSQSGGPYAPLGSTPATIFTDTNAALGATYYYTLSATNLFGESTNAPEIAVTACSPPAAPMNVAASVRGLQAALTWSPASGAASYTVQRFTGITPPVILASGIVGTNFTDTAVTAATTNYYLVSAVNACNQSGYAGFAAAVIPPVGTGPFTWNGGSTVGSYWTDTNNWNGATVTPGNDLGFGGSSRLNNTNDTGAGAACSSITFTSGAGAFTLNGNPLTLTGNMLNNSSNPQTVDLGLNFSNSVSLNGAGGPLIVGGGLTNTFGAPGSTTLTLAGAGMLTNLLKSTASPGGTNILLLNSSSTSWTLLDNAAARPMTVPWVISVNSGALTFGAVSSAPTLTTTTINNTPQDNQVGTVAATLGILTISNGTLTTDARLNTATAANSTGIVNQVSGTFNVGSQFQGANGGNAGEMSFLNVSGGTMNVGSAASPTSPLYVASRGTGTLTLSGGAINCGTLDVSRNANGNSIGSVGTVNLNGGTLSVSRVGTATANSQAGQNGAAATFNFNGGTLKATAGSTTLFGGNATSPAIPITTIVKSGGAVVDDGGNVITILEPLQHDGSLGAAPDGGLTKLNTGRLTLTANSSYSGATTVSAGTLALSGSASISNSVAITLASSAVLDVSGLAGQTLALNPGQTLSGFGTVTGAVLAAGGASVAPGSATGIGALTLTGGLTLNGTTRMKLNKTSQTNDALFIGGNVIYGGTLVLTNLSGPLADGDSFQLFRAANYSSVFSNLVPAIPALNLAWDTNSLATGTLRVVTLPTSRPVLQIGAATGSSLIFSGSNGVPNWPCCVMASTNLATPLSAWTRLATNQFDGAGNLVFTNAIDASISQGFYLLQLQ
jgi:autotransporter-associated beta strand protein